MRRLRRSFSPVAVIFAAVVLIVAGSSRAAVVGGTVQSVSGGRLVIRLRSGDTKSFSVRSTSEVKVDGRPSKLSSLKAGDSVTVVTRGSTVRRISAKSGSADSGPSKGSSETEDPQTPAVQTDRAVARSTLSDRVTARSTRTPGAAEWPSFRGPNRDNVSHESGLLKEWPSGGPKLLWTARGLGEGYSSVTIVDGVVYTMGANKDSEFVHAVDLETGRGLWSAPTGGGLYKDGTGNGPRGTPTIDGDKLYALGGSGDLVCVDLKSRKPVWGKNILQTFDGRNITWGICESVLIDGDRLICTPGGQKATMAALDKNNGRTEWTAKVPGSPRAGYASPIVFEVGGVKQYANFTSKGVIGVRADDGKFMWQNSSSANGTANIATPLFEDGFLFSSSDYGTGGTLLELNSSNGQTEARQVYHTNNMKNHHGGMVIVDGCVYGSNGGILTCLELKSGDVKWKDRSVGKGSVAYADGHIYLRSEKGPVALVEANPEEYREKSRFDQPNRSNKPSWPHPVVAAGRLFLRDQDVLLCYDLTGSE